MLKQDGTELSLSEVMNTWPQTVQVFLRHGMHCVGCRVAPFYTVRDACAEYNLNEAEFRAELCRAINAAPTARPE